MQAQAVTQIVLKPAERSTLSWDHLVFYVFAVRIYMILMCTQERVHVKRPW
jgi:hypothetical protein